MKSEVAKLFVSLSSRYTDAGEMVEFVVVDKLGEQTLGAIDRVENDKLVVVDLVDFSEYCLCIENIEYIEELALHDN